MFNNRFCSNYRKVPMLIILFSVSIANNKIVTENTQALRTFMFDFKELLAMMTIKMAMMVKNVPAG